MLKVRDVNLFLLSLWFSRGIAGDPRTDITPPKTIGLKEDKHPDHLLAVYDGEEFVFEESEWFLVNVIKLIWRYGFDYLRVKRWAESYLHMFMKIYQYQSEGYCFTSVEKLLHGLGDEEFVQMTKHSIDQALQKIGISQRFMKEMVDPIMRLSSGHRVNISAFAGMISLIGTASDLWTVEGGNKLICSGLLYSAKVNLIQGKVISIDTKRRPQRNGELVLLYEVNYTEGADTAYSMYDIVIMAAPFHPGKSQVRLRAFSQPISFTSGRYRQTFITLVEGSLNASYFGCRGSGPFRPTAVGTTANSRSSVLGASVSRPVTAAPDDRLSTSAPVWKVLSPQPLGQEQLSQLFPSREALREARFLSQPRYSPSDESPPFILHDHLYYLNAIEWAASTLEIMALSAKNAALLSHHRWFQQLEKVDQELKRKDEL
ncbi:prenylcysteine oxidase 1-like isoform X2 [Heterodontus francisci]|uniref:prenylcysteine oxidase 1-like isoform X2 n=1 Tax=Heterodontus francisci TaxID=7792 RepID=UPI00355ADE31